MKLLNQPFRDIENHWIVINQKKEIKQINHYLKKQFSSNIPLLGYLYIDHTHGLSILLAGNILKKDNKYKIDEDFTQTTYLFPLEEMENLEATIVSQKLEENVENLIELKKKIPEISLGISSSRKQTTFDTFRHKIYIDDVELTLKGKTEETLWGRIEDSAPDQPIVVCKLLDKSKKQKAYKVNSYVIAKYIDKNLQIISLVSKKEEK